MHQAAHVDRRAFLAALAAGAGMAAWPAGAHGLPARWSRDGARFALLTAGAGDADRRDDARAGARLGAEEAGRAATLLRRDFALIEWDAAPPTDAAAVADWLAAQHVALLVGGFEEAECRMLADAAQHAGALLLNIGCESDALRGSACAPHLFHIAASARMMRDAHALFDGSIDGGAAADAAGVTLWHPALTRFGAGQINERFRERAGRRMSAAAWAGWVAVKIAADAALRARGGDGASIAAQLRSPRAQFDGHKGRPLSFRPWDQQLRQPLYVVGRPNAAEPDGAVLAELPPARAADEGDARALLDSLGAPAADSRCVMPAGTGA